MGRGGQARFGETGNALRSQPAPGDSCPQRPQGQLWHGHSSLRCSGHTACLTGAPRGRQDGLCPEHAFLTSESVRFSGAGVGSSSGSTWRKEQDASASSCLAISPKETGSPTLLRFLPTPQINHPLPQDLQTSEFPASLRALRPLRCQGSLRPETCSLPPARPQDARQSRRSPTEPSLHSP